jgi:hypothetical protein
VEERLFHSDPFDATRTVRDPKYADRHATAAPAGADGARPPRPRP